MNKRGQIFLIAAIIFVISVYSVAIEYNTIKTYPGLEDYKDLSDNYQTEYPKLINFALYNGTNPIPVIDNFTQTFLQEAKKKDPNFGTFYMYKDSQGNLHIVNTLNNKVLNINFIGIDGKEVTITLFSQNTPSKGQICINNVGCNGVNTDIGNFDSKYYQTNIPNPTKMRINKIGDKVGFPIDISEFTSLNYVSSEEKIVALGQGQVGVSIDRY